nr:carotenoid 1,2-hydratase [Paraburkholderia ribeironis]
MSRALTRELAGVSMREAAARLDVAGRSGGFVQGRATQVWFAASERIASCFGAMSREMSCEVPGVSSQVARSLELRLRSRLCPRLRGLLCTGLLYVGLLAASSAFATPGATPADFAAVTPERPITLPQDSGVHAGFRTEWWYATGWLATPDNQPLGFQITFFRSATGHDTADPSAFAPSQLIIAHAALSDPAIGHLAHDQRIARQGFGLAYAKPVNTDVKLDTWKIIRAADGHYDVSVDANGFALHLALTPTQAPFIQGEHGYSRKGPRPEQASYYYSEPQLRVTGSVVRPNLAGSSSHGDTVVTGVAWLDHEWSSTLLDANAVGWDWLGANLADGSALMAFKIRRRDGHAIWAHAALRHADGLVTAFGADQVDFTPVRTWRSPRTNTSYPVSMTVRTGAQTWQLVPLMDDQELDSRQSTGAVYWEGAVRVNRNGEDAGRGYLELTGYANALRIGKE